MKKNFYTYIHFIPFVIIFLFPLLDKSEYHQNVAVLIGIYSIVNIGLNMLLGNAGQISLGQAAFFGIGAYSSAILTTHYHFSFVLSLCLCPIITAILGFFIGSISLKLRGHYLAMATLGFGIIIETIIVEWSELTGGTGGFPNIPPPSILGIKFNNEFRYYYLVWGIVFIIFMVTKNIINSRIGRALFAIHENEVICPAMGIDSAKYKIKIFMLSAAYAGMAGALLASFQNFISPESFSVKFSILFVCMIVIGGIGDVWGSIVGTIALGLFPEFIRAIAGTYNLSPIIKSILNEYSYHLIIYGVFVLIIMVFLPEGIIGGFRKLVTFIREHSVSNYRKMV